MIKSISEAAAAFRRGESSPVDLLEQCLARIDLLEDRIRAWVLVDRDRARADAVRLSAELKQGIDRGPLHGIPVGIKDLFDVEDWPTAAGSKRWENAIARQDCPAVKHLREAGAVLMGKTVTVAYAAFDPSKTRNPWNAERTPGGSSSGSAAAVACGMCLGAMGTQTGGSITRPASYCGVYGIKPTFGLISLEGVVPFAPSFDHGGIIAGNVDDLALLLKPFGATTTAIAHRKVLGLPGGDFAARAEPAMAKAMNEVINRLRSRGWSIVSADLPAAVAEIPRYHRLIMSVEASAYHGYRWQRYPDDYPPKLTDLLREGMAASGVEVVQAYRHHRDLNLEMQTRFPEDIDAYLAPATPGPPPDPATTGTPLFQAPWSYLGLPTISMPFAWTDDGLPLCLQIAGRKTAEGVLVGLGKDLERDIGCEKRDVQG